MEKVFLDYILTQETIFIGLFLFLFYQQNTELKSNREFIKEQQKILERLASRIEGIEVKINMVIEKVRDKK